MRPSRILAIAALMGTTSLGAISTAAADAPEVVTDIPPIQALVSKIMEGVGEPTQLLPQGASPHGYAMRPSQARALSNADLVFWIGPELMPALDRGIESLAEDAESVELLHVAGVETFEYREGPFIGDDGHHDGHDDHGHGDDHKDEHAHDDDHKDEHAHDDDHKHDEHAHDDDHKDEHAHDDHGHEGHDHDGVDPHAWMSPHNLAAWADVIAAKLSAKDPSNASAYFSNAAAEKARIEAAAEQLMIELAPAFDKPFLVFHDAYQYFEQEFGVEVVATLLTSDADKPSAEALSEVRHELEELTETGPVCIFAEPQFDTSLVESVSDGLDIRIARLDPMGSTLPQDNDLHIALIDALGQNIVGCITGS